MLEKEKNGLGASVIVGILGLVLVAWGVFSYVKNTGWFGGKSQGIPAAATQADYAAVGVATTTRVVAAVTTAATPSRTVSVAPSPTLPFAAPPFPQSGWIYDWGSASLANGELMFGAATGTATSSATTGGDVFLTNSGSWKNYDVTANVDWIAGESFGIIARLDDGKNFVYCDFDDNTAQIVSRVNGTDTQIAEAPASGASVGQSSVDLGVEVYGNEVACTVNGNEVLGSAISDNEPANGGIGLISWDATPGVSRIAVKSLQVMASMANDIATPFPQSAPAVVAPASAVVSSSVTATVAQSSSAPLAPAAPAKLEIPYFETDFANDINWQGTWGAVATDTSIFLDIGSAAGTSGGSAILLNTDGWINYTFSATLDWLKGETFMLIGRYVDTGNYVACNFVRDPNNTQAVDIQLEKFVNGNEAILQTGEDISFGQEGDTNIAVAISLQNANATCSFNGHQISNESGNSYGVTPIAGSIGFSTWDPTLGNTEIVIKKVSVASNY